MERQQSCPRAEGKISKFCKAADKTIRKSAELSEGKKQYHQQRHQDHPKEKKRTPNFLQDSGPLHHLFLSKYRASLDPKLISLCLHSLVFFWVTLFVSCPKKGLCAVASCTCGAKRGVSKFSSCVPVVSGISLEVLTRTKHWTKHLVDQELMGAAVERKTTRSGAASPSIPKAIP